MFVFKYTSVVLHFVDVLRFIIFPACFPRPELISMHTEPCFLCRENRTLSFFPPFFVLRRAVVVGTGCTHNESNGRVYRQGRAQNSPLFRCIGSRHNGWTLKKKKRIYIFMYNTYCIHLAVAVTAVQALFYCESEISSYRAPTQRIKLLWGKPKTTRITRNSSGTDDKNLTSLICLH